MVCVFKNTDNECDEYKLLEKCLFITSARAIPWLYKATIILVFQYITRYKLKTKFINNRLLKQNIQRKHIIAEYFIQSRIKIINIFFFIFVTSLIKSMTLAVPFVFILTAVLRGISNRTLAAMLTTTETLFFKISVSFSAIPSPAHVVSPLTGTIFFNLSGFFSRSCLNGSCWKLKLDIHTKYTFYYIEITLCLF